MRTWLRKTLVNRDYARLWYGQALSTTGNYMFDTTLTLWVAVVLGKGRSWAPLATSGVLLCAVVGTVVVGPLAGVFVDRWNRKRLMMHTETFRAGLSLALFGLACAPSHDLPTSVWLAVIYLVVFLLNGAGTFFDPARMATISEVVTSDADRAQASGVGQATNATAGIVGPPMAAPLLFAAGIQWALLINAATFVVSYVAIRGVQVSGTPAGKQPGSRFGTEFREGLRFFFHNRFVVTLLGLAVTAQLGTGAVNALDVFFVTRNLHASAKYYGFLATAVCVGAVIGGLTSGAVVRRIGARNLTWLGAVIAGGFVVLFARQTVFLAGLLVIGLVGVTTTMLDTGLVPLLYKAIPSQYMGRVMAVFVPVNTLSSILSMALAGLLASTALRSFHATVLGIHMGPFDTIFSASGLLIIVAGLIALLTLPGDRDADLAADQYPSEQGDVASEVPGSACARGEQVAVPAVDIHRVDVNPGMAREHTAIEACLGEGSDCREGVIPADALRGPAIHDAQEAEDSPSHVVATDQPRGEPDGGPPTRTAKLPRHDGRA